jgi:uridylate kinase
MHLWRMQDVDIVALWFLNNWDTATTSCNHKRAMFNECFNTIKFNNINGYQGVDAVIDKDKTSALLAAHLQSDQLIILTAVDYVYINYGKDNQKGLGSLSMTASTP